jgi:ABC-type glutathione transport system ATPase component
VSTQDGPPVTETAAIEVSHLTKSFGGRTAVEDVSFRVARREVFGFLGPNGAGKTVTGSWHSWLLPRAEIAGEERWQRRAGHRSRRSSAGRGGWTPSAARRAKSCSASSSASAASVPMPILPVW